MEYSQTSLCKAYTDSKGYRCLERVFDIEDGKLIQYNSDENYPPKYYANRTKLYGNYIYEEDGKFSIWDWTATQNTSDPEKDYLVLKKSSWEPIQYVEIPGIRSVEELKTAITTGFSVTPSCKRIMVGFEGDFFGEGKGFLVDSGNLVEEGGLAKLSESVLSLPLYGFSYGVVSYRNIVFLESIELGNPEKLLCVKDVEDIIRKSIIEKASWPTMKPCGVTKKEWKAYRDFFETLPLKDFYEQIAEQAVLTLPEAKEGVARFFEKCENAFSEEDISDTIIINAIERNEGFRERTLSLLTDRWNELHRADMKVAAAELEKAKHDLRAVEDKKEKLQGEMQAIEGKIIDFTTKMVAAENLSKESETRFREKLEQAKADVAEFIATIPFSLNPVQGQETVPTSVYRSGTDCADSVNETWEDELFSIENELSEAGVRKDVLHAFAAFLYSCYLNSVPVLLAGPNGKDIANAFSTAIFGKTAGVLSCNNRIDRFSLEQAATSPDQAVIVKNLFAPDWTAPLFDRFSESSKAVFYVHPFAEDLTIEPKGLFNYAVPVLTELLVEGRASGKFFGATRAENFKAFSRKKDMSVQRKALSRLHVSLLSQNTIQKVLSDGHQLDPSFDDGCDYLLSILPVAYITGQIDTFRELLDGSELGKLDKKPLIEYLGIDDE